MYRLLFSMMLALCFSGCSTSSTASNPVCYQKTKPNVAFIPMLKNIPCQCDWDLGRELTDSVLNDMIAKNTVYITPYVQFKSAMDSTSEADYFASDLNFANYFCQSDFLVITELSNHEICPYTKEHFPTVAPKRGYGLFQVLVLGARVRVIDLRFEHPKVILQKFIEKHEIVSATEASIDYNSITPTHERYRETPICRGHQKLSAEIANEIEGAILCNW